MSASGSYMEAELPSDASSFSFDGTNSDLARQFYFRWQAGDTASEVTIDAVPDAVQSRLDDIGRQWSDLDGIAQRALLWDSGFGVSAQNVVVQIWTLGNHTMADLDVTLEEFNDVGCVERNCTQSDGTSVYSNLYCNGAQMLQAARCVIEDFDDDASYNAAMWATGGKPDIVPVPRVAKHEWTDNNVTYVVVAVHTLPKNIEPGYQDCPSDENDGYGSLVLPCYTTANMSAVESDRHTVEGTDWVSRWLVENYTSSATPVASSSDGGGSSGGFKMVYLAPIIAGVLVILALVWLGIFCKKRRQAKARQAFEDSPENSNVLLPPPPKNYNPRDTFGRPTVDVTDDHTTSTYTGADLTIQVPSDMSHNYDNAGPNTTLKMLLTSAYLVGKRLPFENLRFDKLLSKGAFGEVWLCQYAGMPVAVKRLLQTKEQKADEVQLFTEEIELTASLQHPHIVEVLGVAWNSLSNLSMVIEYLPVGDLQKYLKANGDLLSWARDKIHIAVGVASALEYLHERSIIHRDLKSKNILLTKQLEPKVIDFGVSRRRLDVTMTAGVGTPYWAAPEILGGGRYTEQADIYSFGVVLSELDTCKVPFHDAKNSNGKKIKPFQILQDVMLGILRPSFSPECPARVRRVGVACCQHDPARRPTAAQVVKMLGSQ